MSPGGSPVAPSSRLWNRSFTIWLIGTAQSQLGHALAGIALSFLVLHQTGSAGQMALTLACSLVPNLLMPLAGAWIDRVNLKIPLIGADIVRGLLQLTVGGLALWWGEVPLWLVNAAAFLSGLAGIFAGPATNAALPMLVPEAELPRANGILGGLSQSAYLLGTLGGGLIVSAFSPAAAIMADGFGFLIMASLLLFVQVPGRNALPTGQRPGIWADLRSGLKLMSRSRLLTFIPLLALLINITTGPVMVVTPKLMESLGYGAKGYGVFLALESVGLLVAGAIFGVLGKRIPLRLCALLGFLLLSASLLGMWLLPTYTPLIAFSFGVGLSIGLLNTPIMTLLQQNVPGEYLGRVFSVLSASASLGMPLTLLIVAPFVDHLPLNLWFGLNAAVMLLGAVIWAGVILIEREVPDLKESQV